MRHFHILQTCLNRPWLITPQGHSAVMRAVEASITHAERAPGVNICGDAVPVAQMEIVQGTACIPISGVIGQKLGAMERGFGATDINDVMNDFRAAMADESVSAIALMIDSPGGTVSGVPEAAAEIAAARGIKPITAYTDGLIASAAYYIASSADEIVGTMSSEVGSIGVYQALLDVSRAYADQGVSVELIKAGKFKAAGYPGTSLTTEQRAQLQGQVDQIHKMFTDHVKANRAVSDDAMQGQTFIGSKALEAGLIDRIGSVGVSFQNNR